MHSVIHLLLPFLATSTLVHSAAIEAIRTVPLAPSADDLGSRDNPYEVDLEGRDFPQLDDLESRDLLYVDQIESRDLPYLDDLEARALPNASCPDWKTIEPPEKYLGPPPNGKCSWQETLICASLVVGCPTGCIAAAMEIGLNPFATTECIACMGVTGGNCAFCIWGTNLASTCNAIYWEPQAHCLLPMCSQKLLNEAKAHPPAQVLANRLLPALNPKPGVPVPVKNPSGAKTS
ncbi:MAG: hypothetical protein FRX48_00583 [Lasallia pustulata]|uniref:Uncharacterized protein n=1 Tax=Lasallia pustulata TaxID=136370 RepID=A0A5M8Q3T1_9LECA|nr:MAG: hypothetical protein FRX48_00583 [Lasallia pustulata]